MASKDAPPTLKNTTGLIMSVVGWLIPPLINRQPNKKRTAEAAASGATALFVVFWYFVVKYLFLNPRPGSKSGYSRRNTHVFRYGGSCGSSKPDQTGVSHLEWSR